MRIQANPDGTILAQNDIELLCEVYTWRIDSLLNYFEIGDRVHRIFRAIEKKWVVESGGPPGSAPGHSNTD
jgi:hypothetical protein